MSGTGTPVTTATVMATATATASQGRATTGHDEGGDTRTAALLSVGGMHMRDYLAKSLEEGRLGEALLLPSKGKSRSGLSSSGGGEGTPRTPLKLNDGGGGSGVSSAGTDMEGTSARTRGFVRTATTTATTATATETTPPSSSPLKAACKHAPDENGSSGGGGGCSAEMEVALSRPVSAIHEACQKVFKDGRIPEFEWSQDGLLHGATLLLDMTPSATASDPSPTSRVLRFETKPTFLRRKDAKGAAAKVAIEEGVLERMADYVAEESKRAWTRRDGPGGVSGSPLRA